MENRNQALILLTVCLCIIQAQCQDSVNSLRCLARNREAGKRSDRLKPCEVDGITVQIFLNGNQQFRNDYTPDCPNLQANHPSAVGFILDTNFLNFAYYRDSSRVPVCSSISGMSVAERPTWVDSANQALANENIKTHCFVQESHAVEQGRFPYKTLYRIVNEDGNWYWREIGYLLPDSENYLVFNGYADIDRYCARCVINPKGSSGFQTSLADPPKNLTATLQNLIKQRTG